MIYTARPYQASFTANRQMVRPTFGSQGMDRIDPAKREQIETLLDLVLTLLPQLSMLEGGQEMAAKLQAKREQLIMVLTPFSEDELTTCISVMQPMVADVPSALELVSSELGSFNLSWADLLEDAKSQALAMEDPEYREAMREMLLDMVGNSPLFEKLFNLGHQITKLLSEG